MNSHFDPDDPRLTAYALGDLPDPADRAHIEALLAASPEARAELADIRELTAALTADYEQDRLTTPADQPPNVIQLSQSPHRRAWLRPLLAAAAVLLLAGLTFSLLPVFNLVEVKGQRAQSAVFAVSSKLLPPVVHSPASTPTGSVLAEASSAQLAKKSTVPTVEDLVPGAATPSSATAAAPLLAQAQLPAFELKDSRTLDDMEGKDALAPTPAQSGNFTLKRAAAITLDQNRTKGLGSTDRQYDVNGSITAAPALAYADAGVSSAAPGEAEAPVKELNPRAPSAAPPGWIADGPSTTRLIQRGRSAGLDTPAAPIVPGSNRRTASTAFNTAAYDHVTETPFLAAKENPLSTFSVDVDTASYSIVRRFIEGGSLPPAGAVRIEEMLNYFPYDYAPPAPGDERPFAIHLEGAACPWNPDHRLVRVALQGREMAPDKRPPSNLVFLIDVSGSMEPPERLPLIKESLRLLVDRLTDHDRVAIVTYAGNSGLALPSTNGAHKDTILHALDRLEAGGSTNGAAGIQLAYKVAQENFLQGGTNRVILATDGDFNVGTTSQGELVRLIETEAKGGVFLTALGVGTDNLKDSTMQKLADHGNGHYAYLDRIEEARKVLVEQMSGTLVTIAKDVKIQVEFNPAAVNSYRLVGYEKRLLRKEDFNDDRVDAGEIGAGHSVTALYEVVPAGQPTAVTAPAVDALKYQAVSDGLPTRAATPPADAREMLTVKIRHKAPDSDTSERSYEAAFVDHGTAADYANATPDFKFAAAVASFGLVLRDSPYKGSATLGAAIELAQEGKGTDATGYRAGFIELARRAETLRREAASSNR